jgi:hypothetical protein
MRSARTAHKIAPFWEPSFVVPIQWKAKSPAEERPEMRLATAIFEDAWQSVARAPSDRREGRGRDFREARDWFLDDSRSWPFAFLNLCELLALDPNAVRQSLRDHLATEGQEKHPDAPTPLTSTGQPTRAATQRQHLPQRDVTTLERFEILGWDEA